MQFILMDLIGPFDPSSSGYHYALTMMCMLIGYTLCIPLKTKTACKVVQACIDEANPLVIPPLELQNVFLNIKQNICLHPT